jgi:hypothetical protein
VLRRHVGDQLKNLFPLLPNYGKTLGSDRSFCESLKWTAMNPCKTMNLGNSTYKSHIMAPKDLLDDRAASLIDKNPGIIKIKEESKDLSGFEEGCIQGVSNFLNRQGAGERMHSNLNSYSLLVTNRLRLVTNRLRSPWQASRPSPPPPRRRTLWWRPSDAPPPTNSP